MPFSSWRMKTYRPVLNRAHSLCRGMIFACAPGWTNGFTQGATAFTDYDDFTLTRGQWNTPPLNASPWQGFTGHMGGRGIDNGDGSFTAAPEWLTPAGDTRYDVSFGWSACVLVRPDVLSTDATIPIFKHRNQPYGATDSGWHFSAKAGNAWRVAFSNGAAEVNASSTTTQNVNRGDLLHAVYDRVNLNLYVNGVLEGQTATTNAMGNPANTPIKFIGLGTAGAGQPAYSGAVTMGMVWERANTPSEVSKVYSDPFIAWRASSGDDEAFAAYQTFLASF